MIIPIHLPAPSSSNAAVLPPQLVRIGANEVVLIELQGALQVEGDRSGQMAGKLHFTDPVHFIFTMLQQKFTN